MIAELDFMQHKRYAYTEERKRKDARLFIRRMRNFFEFSAFSYYLKSKAKTPGPGRAVRYQCAKCKASFKAENVEVDHITEMGAVVSIKDWDWSQRNALQKFAKKYMDFFLNEKNLQVLCRHCHRLKTYKIGQTC